MTYRAVAAHVLVPALDGTVPALARLLVGMAVLLDALLCSACAVLVRVGLARAHHAPMWIERLQTRMGNENTRTVSIQC